MGLITNKPASTNHWAGLTLVLASGQALYIPTGARQLKSTTTGEDSVYSGGAYCGGQRTHTNWGYRGGSRGEEGWGLTQFLLLYACVSADRGNTPRV